MSYSAGDITVTYEQVQTGKGSFRRRRAAPTPGQMVLSSPARSSRDMVRFLAIISPSRQTPPWDYIDQVVTSHDSTGPGTNMQDSSHLPPPRRQIPIGQAALIMPSPRRSTIGSWRDPDDSLALMVWYLPHSAAHDHVAIVRRTSTQRRNL